MRRKIVVVSFLVLALLCTATAVVALERQRTPDWQSALNQYLEQNQFAGDGRQLLKAVRATAPGNFQEGIAPPWRDAAAWQWHIDQLPYPPDQLYCLFLQSSAPETVGEEPARQLLYVSHHSDKLYRVGWLVHEGPVEPFPPEYTGTLSILGCDLEVDASSE